MLECGDEFQEWAAVMSELCIFDMGKPGTRTALGGQRPKTALRDQQNVDNKQFCQPDIRAYTRLYFGIWANCAIFGLACAYLRPACPAFFA